MFNKVENNFSWSLPLSTIKMTSKCTKLKGHQELRVSGFIEKFEVGSFPWKFFFFYHYIESYWHPFSLKLVGKLHVWKEKQIVPSPHHLHGLYSLIYQPWLLTNLHEKSLCKVLVKYIFLLFCLLTGHSQSIWSFPCCNHNNSQDSSSCQVAWYFSIIYSLNMALMSLCCFESYGWLIFSLWHWSFPVLELAWFSTVLALKESTRKLEKISF